MVDNLSQFAEKYQLALQSAQQEIPDSGMFGFELEWNLLDEEFSPVKKVPNGSEEKSFVDFLRENHLSPEIKEFSQLEVFHWMIEWATRPYYTPRRAVYEARIMEALTINALDGIGNKLGKRLYHWHGNLLDKIEVNSRDIPDSWHLAKRRYLERCVDMYGPDLATAGMHTNLSLPTPLFAWDFMHLKPIERGSKHLDDFKSEFYITATRLLRAFAAMFIATGASTPLHVQIRQGEPKVVVTERDSIRNLTFPNPTSLDVPDLYRSYEDYLRLSYELVRNGSRFGNNNWTPVRARSFAEPVERLIAVTSEQLQNLYSRGLYRGENIHSVEEMAQQIEAQNLMARINLPMARVEVRTDDGGQPMDVEIANITLKHLLLLKFYEEPQFARAFRYDQEDLSRARRNEEKAAWHGLRSEIENPFTGKPVEMRKFLAWTLEEVKPVAKVLGYLEDLEPLYAMAGGEPNTAERMRSDLKKEAGPDGIISKQTLRDLSEKREQTIREDVNKIMRSMGDFSTESGKLKDLFSPMNQFHLNNQKIPIRITANIMNQFKPRYENITDEIIHLAEVLIKIPSVTACPQERLEDVYQAGLLVYEYLKSNGLSVEFFDQGKYPAVLAYFPGQKHSRVMLSGHFDVVEPEPDDSQFSPLLDGDYLWGRGAADMKVVVATYMVWMKEQLKKGPPFPPINLLLIGNEENGEAEPTGSPHVLERLMNNESYVPDLFIAGERTGEKGDELWTEVCIQNRGVIRLDVVARGVRGHSGVASVSGDLGARILAARSKLEGICGNFLTLQGEGGWQSQVRFPFIQVGVPGIYNVTPDEARMGVEIRPIPNDDVNGLVNAIQEYCDQEQLELETSVMEHGIACDPDNQWLQYLIQAIKELSGVEPNLGKKLPGTSARFAPKGQGIVWGQSGIGPHSLNERHFIPSIKPYYDILNRYAEILKTEK